MQKSARPGVKFTARGVAGVPAGAGILLNGLTSYRMLPAELELNFHISIAAARLPNKEQKVRCLFGRLLVLSKYYASK